jgi:hypothetical protein
MTKFKEDWKTERFVYLLGALFLATLLYLVTGCATTYEVKVFPDGRVEAESKSYREFAVFQLEFDPITKHFYINAVGVTDDTSEVVEKVVGATGQVVSSALSFPPPDADARDWQLFNQAWTDQCVDTMNRNLDSVK